MGRVQEFLQSRFQSHHPPLPLLMPSAAFSTSPNPSIFKSHSAPLVCVVPPPRPTSSKTCYCLPAPFHLLAALVQNTCPPARSHITFHLGFLVLGMGRCTWGMLGKYLTSKLTTSLRISLPFLFKSKSLLKAAHHFRALTESFSPALPSLCGCL